MNITGKYLMVWKKKTTESGLVKLDLGDSKKNKEGAYDSWTWFDCLLLGNAKSVEVNERDKIEITSGIIYQEKYNEKWYTRVIIFDFNVMSQAPKQDPPKEKPAAGPAPDFEDDIPF